MLCVCVCVCVCVLYLALVGSPSRTCSFFSYSTLCLVDFTTLVLPVLLAFTILANHAMVLNATCCCIACGFLLICKPSKTLREPKRAPSLSEVLNSVTPGKQPFIGNFRAYVLIATAIGILAVDFVIFPRRFAKAETYGVGLMDVGVGAFVISNSIVAPEARGVSTRNESLFSSVLRSIKSSLPLLLLGFMRLAAVKSTDYQEHVSEYGTHWNFFFTLFVVRVSVIRIQVIVVYIHAMTNVALWDSFVVLCWFV